MNPSTIALYHSRIFSVRQAHRDRESEDTAMASINGIRSSARVLISSASLSNSGTRGLHATAVKRMGGGHGHDSEPYYMHAKHMYNLDRMKYQKLTMSLSVLAAFSIGVAVPVYAVIFQQKKTVSG